MYKYKSTLNTYKQINKTKPSKYVAWLHNIMITNKYN